MGFIDTFLLPKTLDFDNSLLAQAHNVRIIVEGLRKACVENHSEALAEVMRQADAARDLKSRNMKELLDVFIAPYDKESIYRIITQMEWIALSVKHFVRDIEAYGINSVAEYRPVFEVLLEMTTLFEKGMSELSGKSAKAIAPDIERIHERYDQVVALCAQSSAQLLSNDDCKHIIVHMQILAQLREVAKRIQVTANSLEDMALKVV